MRRDETVFLIGEDVGKSGGIFKCSEGLFEEFGDDRVIDAPIAEAGYIGVSVGAAMTGMRPIAELMFGDFSLLTMDQLVNQAAKVRYMTGGQCKVRLTVRLSMGAGRSSAAQHSQSLHALFAHIPGLKVAVPSCPEDVKGLLKTASPRRQPCARVRRQDDVQRCRSGSSRGVHHTVRGGDDSGAKAAMSP